MRKKIRIIFFFYCSRKELNSSAYTWKKKVVLVLFFLLLCLEKQIYHLRYSLYQLLVNLSVLGRIRLNKTKTFIPEELYVYMSLVILVKINI